ncbi:cytochrome d ubiquinol oxidase subunit II [Paenirhodobacter sp.]|uniref:cytochrome d ubiquinol oxidase subunit II n=1 Tax=Paenirhodobacter sp. TaxID=1965326 RepID=UPI003B419A73
MILHELVSFDLLRVIWWGLLGILLIGFAVMDGFDLGAAVLLPFVAKTDAERRIVINSVGPVWEGNQVWLILGGGAIFAAWPPLYAVSFSGFYLAIFAILAALILRPVGFKYRSKRESLTWRRNWDWALFVGGFVPALVFGVACGNVLQGVPFELNEFQMPLYPGPFWWKFAALLNPFGLLAGVVSLTMLVTLGAAWLSVKTDGPVRNRARRIGTVAGVLAIVAYVLAGVWMAYGIEAYRIVSPHVPDGPSNPLLSEVVRGGSWMDAYAARPWIWIAPVLGVVGLALAVLGLRAGREVPTLVSAQAGIFGVIASVGLPMFPFILPSSVQPNASLTVWSASSSHLTLFVMLICAVIFVPIIMAYTAWVYRVLWGKVTAEEVAEKSHTYY